VQETTHVPADRARFAELACRLLDGADVATRALIAERLSAYPATPVAVAAKLARDEISVAKPVLLRSSVLSEAELHAILDFRGPAHAAVIAERAGLPKSIAQRLRRAGLLKAAEEQPKRSSPTAPTTDPALTLTLARRFLVTDSGERLTILAAIACCPPVGAEARLNRIDRAFHGKLEAAALRHRSAEFVSLVRDHTGMPRDIAGRVVAESSGEPLAAFCRALEMPFSIASRILLFLNPAIGGSVERVFGLAGRFEAMQPANARRLAAAWCQLGEGLRPERSKWTRTVRERIDPRPVPVRSIRGVTPARPATANES
jgi:uncharacterized protein (DUF2336 family)